MIEVIDSMYRLKYRIRILNSPKLSNLTYVNYDSDINLDKNVFLNMHEKVKTILCAVWIEKVDDIEEEESRMSTRIRRKLQKRIFDKKG